MTDEHLPTPAIPAVAESAPRLNLVVQEGPQAGTRIPCRRIVTMLGARAGCKVVLDHRRVAPVHLLLVNDGQNIKAVDLLTDSGTKLNGLNVQNERLSDGDVLSIDQWEFKVEIETPMHEGEADVHPFDLEPTPNVVALEVVEGGRLLQPNRDVCVIGRRNGCDIVLSDTRVSRAHAALLNYFGYPAIVDLLTPEGTYVNDQPIRFQSLKDGEIIRIGETRFRVRVLGSSVGEKRNGNHNGNGADAVRLAAEPVSADLIDIQETEGAQRWQVADNLERIQRATAHG